MPLIYLSSAWVAGIFLGAHFQPHFLVVFSALLPLLLLFMPRHRKTVILSSLCLVVLFGGIFRFQSASDTGIQSYNVSTVQIKGTMADELETRD